MLGPLVTLEGRKSLVSQHNWTLIRVNHVDSNGICACYEGINCLSPGKHPVDNEWTANASTHLTTIDAVVRAVGPTGKPDSNLGVLTGEPSGVVVVDADGEKGAKSFESLRQTILTASRVDIANTLRVKTARGMHYYYQNPTTVFLTNKNKNLKAKYPNLDIRGNGGMVVAPFSTSGYGFYAFENNLAVMAMPQELIDIIQTPDDVERQKVDRALVKSRTDLPEELQRRADAYATKGVENQLQRFVTEYDSENWDDLTNAIAFSALQLANSPWNDLETGSIYKDETDAWVISKTGVVADLFDKGFDGGDHRWTPERKAKCIRSAYASVCLGKNDLVRDLPDFLKTELEAKSATKELGILPEEFWSARPSLAHVRQAARSRRRSGEAALAGLFARFGSMVDPGVKVDTGIADPLSLNAFTALIGTSGSGKSASKSIPKRLVPTPTFSNFNDREYVGMGSGEGMIEAYLDFVTVETGELKKNGEPATTSVKKQVHSNVLFYLDEGESLTTLLGRNGSTLGATIRSAWMGEKLGQMNAQKETTRTLTEGKYSMGFIVGLQLEACTRLMEDAAYGTPHRFYFSRVTDPNQPDDRCDWPGSLAINPVQVANTAKGFTVVDSITDRLDADDLARQRGLLRVNPLNTHEPAMRAKLSAFIAALDGRTLVTEEDWDLSGMMWVASCEVRDEVMAYLNAKKAAEISAKDAVHVNREVKIDDAKREKSEAAQKITALAKRVATWVHEAKKGITRREVGQKMNSTDRKLLDEAIEVCAVQDWAHFDADGRTLLPGNSRPTD